MTTKRLLLEVGGQLVAVVVIWDTLALVLGDRTWSDVLVNDVGAVFVALVAVLAYRKGQRDGPPATGLRVEPDADTRTAAAHLYSLRRSYLDAGFTEREANLMVRTVLANVAQQQGGGS